MGGRNNFLGNEKSEIQKLLKNFDFISVREKNGINLCKQIGRNDAKWVCDPTLLLNADIYRTIYKEIVENKLITVESIAEKTTASTGCGGCVNRIESLIEYAKKNNFEPLP